MSKTEQRDAKLLTMKEETNVQRANYRHLLEHITVFLPIFPSEQINREGNKGIQGKVQF